MGRKVHLPSLDEEEATIWQAAAAASSYTKERERRGRNGRREISLTQLSFILVFLLSLSPPSFPGFAYFRLLFQSLHLLLFLSFQTGQSGAFPQRTAAPLSCCIGE